MKTISRLLLACAAVTIAASQADAGEFVVTGVGGYRYRNAPPPAYAHGPWRYRRDWAPRYYAPQYHNDLGAAIAGALAGAALQLIPRATEALAARLPPPPGAPPVPPVAAPPLAPNAAAPPAPDMPPPPVAAVPRRLRRRRRPSYRLAATRSMPFRIIRRMLTASPAPRSRPRSPTGAPAMATRRCVGRCRRNEGG